MIRKLTDTQVRKAKPKRDGKPYSLSDGGGLFLYVERNGKYWRYNYRINGKQKTLSIAPIQM